MTARIPGLRHPPGDVVMLSTIHSVNGLAWELCSLPGSREADEERRIAYVGMSRARFRLGVSYAAEQYARTQRLRSLVDLLDPAVHGLRLRLGPLDAVGSHMRDAVRDPLAMLLDDDRDVARHQRAARAGVDEQVREAGGLQSEVIARPDLPGSGTGASIGPVRYLGIEIDETIEIVEKIEYLMQLRGGNVPSFQALPLHLEKRAQCCAAIKR